MPCRSKKFGVGVKGELVLAAMALVLAPVAFGAAPVSGTAAPSGSSAPVPPLILSGRQSTRPAGTYSTGIGEIIAMLDAKVSTEVLLAYIENSSIPYNPDATELIALKSHGASAEV